MSDTPFSVLDDRPAREAFQAAIQAALDRRDNGGDGAAMLNK
jgi:hypothetical protein